MATKEKQNAVDAVYKALECNQSFGYGPYYPYADGGYRPKTMYIQIDGDKYTFCDYRAKEFAEEFNYDREFIEISATDMKEGCIKFFNDGNRLYKKYTYGGHRLAIDSTSGGSGHRGDTFYRIADVKEIERIFFNYE